MGFLRRVLLASAVLSLPDDGAGGAGAAGGVLAPPAATPPAPAPGPDAVKLAADLASTSAQLKALQDKAKADDAARKANDQKLLEEQGQHKTLAEQRLADLEAANKKLADLESDAAIGRTYREAQQKVLDEAGAKLSPDDKALLDALPTIEAKTKFLARIGTTPAPAAAQPAGAGATPPPPGAGADIPSLIAAKGVDWVKRSYPKEWEAYADKSTPRTGRRGGLF